MPNDAIRPWGEGIYRRRIRLCSTRGGVVADLEDDFHRFRVMLEHDGHRLTRVRGEARRYPWSACPGATEPLKALAGMALSPDCRAVADHADPRTNCTHLFDLAGLAAAHAAAGRSRRQYDVEVPDRKEGRTSPRLQRDGAPRLAWELDDHEIREPAPFAGRSLSGRAFLEWARAELSEDLAEAACVLRRASYIAIGRSTPLDRIRQAKVFLPRIQGSCHTFTPGIAETATRVVGSTLDFSDAPERLLADLRD